MEHKQSSQVRSFGSGDTPNCPNCDGDMRLWRRTPHPEFGNSYELQSFRCAACGCSITRSADLEGRPHE